MALTRRQRQVLDVIRGFIERNGYSPSLEEIGSELGLSSVATVHKHVSHLVDKGFVRRTWNQNRSIEMVDVDAVGAVRIPLAGVIAAGQPLESSLTFDPISVPVEMLRDRAGSYALKVQGDSMMDEGIRDGDLVIVERRPQARDGETVVALIDGHRATLKRFFRSGGKVRLQPANPRVEPILVHASRLQVQGVVIGVIRRF